VGWRSSDGPSDHAKRAVIARSSTKKLPGNTPVSTAAAASRRGVSLALDDELTKLQYDLYYIRHQSLAFDVAILIRTLAVMLRLAGR